MSMASPDTLLIVGSLPPAVCNSARLTEATARAFLRAGFDVTVLIDELAPPPADDLGLKIVRPFDDQVQKGIFDTWPRLYIAGNSAPGLSAIRMLQDYPGAVMVADNSLYDSALMAFDASVDHNAAIENWLVGAAGQDGKTLARSLTHHRRRSTAIGDEVSGYDTCLSAATAHIALSALQEAVFADAGFQSVHAGPPPFEQTIHQAAKRSAGHPLRALVFGLEPSSQSGLLAHLTPTDMIDVSFSLRHAETAIAAIEASDVVIVMDGFGLPFCPLTLTSLARGRAVVCANQAWSADLPMGCVLPVSHHRAMAELAITLQALAQTPDLQITLADNYGNSATSDQQAKNWCNTVLEAAASAKRMRPPKSILPPDVNVKSSMAVATSTEQSKSSVCALIGSAPAPAILAQQFQGLDNKHCPKFLTLELAEFLAAFIEEPLLRVPGMLGFEEPLILSAQSGSMPDMGIKVADWSTVQPALLHAQDALAFGCTVDGIPVAEAAKPKEPAEWIFRLPEKAFVDAGCDSVFDEDTGIFCKLDRTRRILTVICFTGTAGTLSMSVNTSHTLVATDNKTTLCLQANEAQPFKVGDHGVVAVKIAAAPAPSGEPADLTKTLAKEGLLLEWSPL